jgi:protein-S-isoprenylcysteine O-methyltransferase Ste14
VDGTTWTRFRTTKAYDLLAAAPLFAWFGYGLYRDGVQIALRLPGLGGAPLTGKLQFLALGASAVFSALLIAMLVLRDVPRVRASGLVPRLAAVVGTFLGTGFLYLRPVILPLDLQLAADVFVIGGTLAMIWVLLRLARSFSIVPEARKLVTGGPYAVVRHPLYAVEEIVILGLVLQYVQPFALILGLCQLAVQIVRASYEERVLADAFPEYAQYRARTWRFIPYVY